MTTFHLGLTMAGAISAGAYSAGVFDFLVEALDAWEKRRRELEEAGTPPGEWDVPRHRVVIPVVSGASAGGITGALGLLALAEQQPAGAVPRTRSYDGVGDVTFRLPRLYAAWVERIRFVGQPGQPDLLGTSDLDKGPIRSLLDTTILEEISGDALTGIREIAPPRPYLADEVHLFLTHSNIRGVPYEVRFTGGGQGEPGYGMMCHADRRHYVIEGVGSTRFDSVWASPDPAVRLDVNALPALSDAAQVWSDPLWGDYCNAVLGTSAFPIGLSGRPITRLTVADYAARQWPLARYVPDRDGHPAFRLEPAFPATMAQDPQAAASYLTLDGGMINNEPFELARWSLLERPPARNPRDADESDRAVLMVDPFPAPPDYAMENLLEPRLKAVAARLLPTMLNQARFKPDDLADALDETVLSRFLIAPRRRAAKGAPLERHAIACGLLGGFGGFLSESFRAHDYQLGRLNCYLFLKEGMALPLSNRVVAAGYGDMARRDGFATDSGVEGDDRPFYPLIPLVGSAAAMPEPPRWPRVATAEVDEMVARAEARAEALYRKVLTGEVRSRVGRLGVRALWRLSGKGMVRNLIRYSVLRDLYLRDQIEGPMAGRPEDERRIIATLADTRYDFRTVEGVSKELALDAATVGRVLADGHYAPLVHTRKRRGEPELFTLKERAPGRFSQWFGVRQTIEWFTGAPAVDI